jgi:hypothetical protein
MTPTRFRECLAVLGLTQRGLAPLLGCNDREVRHWAAGSRLIPPKVADWLEEWVLVRTLHPDPKPPQDWRIGGSDLDVA